MALGNLVGLYNNLIKQEIVVPEIELDEYIRNKLEVYLRGKDYFGSSLVIEPHVSYLTRKKGVKTYFSNQFFYIATLGRDLAFTARKYFDHIDSCIRSNNDAVCIINDLSKANKDNDKPYVDVYNSLSASPVISPLIAGEDAESWCSLLGNAIFVDKSPLGKGNYLCKGFPNTQATGFRPSEDLFESMIDTALKVEVASSGVLGEIVYYLTFNEILFQEIDAHIKLREQIEDVLSQREESQPEEEKRLENGRNILLYGVPGSGKSYTIANEYCKSIQEDHIQRVVFHPDYSYSDFVGQILPKVTKKEGSDTADISYEFGAGPFTDIVAKAYKKPAEKFVLIIEELNRGNAPAIFGEMFQLLDRKQERRQNDNGLQIGSSEYGINNKDVAFAVYGDEDHKVYIPSNLEILATMNTSDQNVFTLDTAFQRRWQMRLLENSFDTVKTSLAKAEILDTGIDWEQFCTSVNHMIVSSQSDIASSEDKRLGVYFVVESDMKMTPIDSVADSSGNRILLRDEYKALLKKKANAALFDSEESRLQSIIDAMQQNRKFPEKVLKYLWDDVFKFNRDEFFKKEMNSLENVVSEFIFSEGVNRWKSILSDKAIGALGLNG